MISQDQNNTGAVQMVVLFLIVQLLSGTVPLFLPETTSPTVFLTLSVVLFTLGAVGMIFIERKKKMAFEFEESFLSNASTILLWGIAGLFISIFAQNIAAMIEENFLGNNPESVNTQQLIEVVRAYPAFIVLIGIAGPIMEEFVFRKAIFGTLIGKIGGVGAAIISSLIFAVIHFDGLLLVYSSMGFVFAWLYYKTKNIWTPIIAHCLMNTIAVLANLYLG